MSIYVNNGDGERELREIETPRGVVTSVSVNHGDGDGEQKVWTHASKDGIIEEGLLSVYDAQALSGYSDGDPVNEWPDTEGNYLLTAASGAEPTYRVDSYQGNPALEFTGGEYFEPVEFDEVETQPYTYYAVLEFEGGSGRSYPFYGLNADGDRGFIDLNDSENFEMWAGSPGTFQFPQTNDPVVVACVFDGSNSVFRIDDEEQSGDPGEMDQRGHSISHARNPMRGSIAELRTYDIAHQKEERNEVIAYLAAKHDAPLSYEINESEYTGLEGATYVLDYDTAYDSSQTYNGAGNIYNPSNIKGTCELDQTESFSGDTSLKYVTPSEQRVGTMNNYFGDHSDVARPNEYYTQFAIKFDDFTFDSDTGTHRFYWLAYRFGSCASGGTCTPSGDDGWSVVLSMAGEGRGSYTHPNRELRVGKYHMDGQSDLYRTGATWNTNEWTTFGGYIKNNTYMDGTANSDGIVRVWIDGNLVHNETSMRFVTTDNQGSDVTSPMGYSIGVGADQEYRYDDHGVWLGDDIPQFAIDGTNVPE